MANCCFFNLKAKGFTSEKEQNLFIKMFGNHLIDDDSEVSTDMSYWSMDSNVDNVFTGVVCLSGDAKWSLNNIVREYHPNQLKEIELGNNKYFIDGLLTATAYFGIEVEIYGEGDDFTEYYHMKYGEIIEEDSEDLHWVDLTQYDSYQDFQDNIVDEADGHKEWEEKLNAITDFDYLKILNEEGGFYIGGFGNWEWKI